MVDWLPGALALEDSGAVDQLPGFAQGLFHVQDLSSQLCCFLLSPKPGQTVADVCSAPGGKAFTMAEWMENQGKLLAFDKYKGKVGLIRQGAQRLGLSIIEAQMRDATRTDLEPLDADCVLCDAPCAGLGIIRRKPEIRYKNRQGVGRVAGAAAQNFGTGCPSGEVRRGFVLFHVQLESCGKRPGGRLVFGSPWGLCRHAAGLAKRNGTWDCRAG